MLLSVAAYTLQLLLFSCSIDPYLAFELFTAADPTEADTSPCAEAS